MSNRSHVYRPQPGSLPHRVCSFFKKHPEEELNAKDIALKFDYTGTPGNISVILDAAIAAGLIARDGKDFKAGPRLADAELGEGGPPASSTAQPSTSRLPWPGSIAGTGGTSTPPSSNGRGKGPRLPRVFVDIEQVTLRDDVPPPSLQPGIKGPDWDALLVRMKPGQSFEVPIRARYSIGKAVTRASKTHPDHKWTKRTSPDRGVVEVWRVA